MEIDLNKQVMDILKISSFKLACILYFPTIIQITIDRLTGVGMIVGGVTIGLFPDALIYFFWMLLLTFELGENQKKLKRVIVELLVTIFLVLPFYWFLLNRMMKDSQLMVALSPVGGLVFAWMVFVLIDSWRFLSKGIQVALNKKVQPENTAGFGSIFLWFLGGIFTVWWLQPLIIKALNGKPNKADDKRNRL